MIRAGGALAQPTRSRTSSSTALAPPARPARSSKRIATAQAIVIGPSNPIVSIGPMLAIPELRSALNESPAAIVAVSPLVDGEVVKGPTAAFMEFTGLPLSADGIAAYYEGIIDGLVSDRRTDRVPVLETDVLMASADARQRVAEEALRFALALR